LLRAVLARVNQHADLRETLLATGDSAIVEHTENADY
jgi:N-glycosidase YbiA